MNFMDYAVPAILGLIAGIMLAGYAGILKVLLEIRTELRLIRDNQTRAGASDDLAR